MAHRTVYPTRSGRYGTRILTADEPVLVSGPLAREMIALGRATDVAPKKGAKRPQLDHDNNGVEGGSVKQTDGEIAELRAAYREKFDRAPFNGWSAEALREKLA